ncbi:E3 ubiquitin-protein ligase SH3RF1 [Electrophorus electricus]|uniref:E3 ubiquitin-protein ligase SH3RF1 n=1 Tax=Electrophorus electricus TaxID=8005 RepID=A0A4W4G0I5_ELEEL|nr:E3 ubiquitin-protein ligase SH3RF1 [Electrophorus electricus]
MMDESALLDLLECPVCLERLDATAKVLPCQHTFCRRCLLGIVGSRGELRCPECRTLVGSGVEELPSNILLVRLLDGIKQQPRRAGVGMGAGVGPATACTNGSAGGGTRNQAAGGGQREQGTTGTQPQRVQTKSTPVRGVPQLPCAKALYNYDGKEPGDLAFSKGDIIILRRQVDENWYHGEVGGVHGFFPASFVQVLKPLPQPPPQCKALYDFELRDKEADKDCLPFSKDDILTVIRRVDQNWAEGMLGDKIGIFPISYVEFNTAARQLIELDKPPEGASDSGEGPSSSSSSSSSGPQANGPQKSVVVAGEKKNSKKRHSFTSLTMSHKPCLAVPPPQRHSMEISGPVLISSSNPTAAARIGELSGGLSSSAPSQVHICTTGLIVTPPPSSPVTTATVFTFPSETSYAAIPVDVLPPPPPPPPQSSAAGATTSLAAGQRPSPTASDQSGRQRPTVYVAMFAYTPRKEDELELRKGEMFLVLERCQDGWFKGTSMHTGKIGVFPGNYMTPVSRTAASSGQPKVPLTLGSQAGRGITIISPSSTPLGPTLSGGDPSKPLPVCTGPVPSGPLPAAVVTAAHTPTGQHTKVLMHVTSQMTVNQARNAVRTAVCHNQDRPTAAVTPIQSQNTMAFLPHSAVCPQQSPAPCLGPASSPVTSKMGVAMGCAASSLTPPNVSAASLEVDTMRPTAMVALPVVPGNARPVGATATNQTAAYRLDKDCKREKKGLLKLLSNKKKLRPSPPSSPTLEVEPAIAADLPQGAVGPDMPPPTSAVLAGGNHGRTGSCLGETETSATAISSSASSSSSSSMDAVHRRNSSQDNSAPIAPPPRQPCSSLLSVQHDGRPIVCERYRVVVSYPPQSEAELELKEGDIVFVHKKREDGWFKGTLQRNGRTGLFPGSFVDSI